MSASDRVSLMMENRDNESQRIKTPRRPGEGPEADRSRHGFGARQNLDALPAGAGTAVDYAPARDARKPAAARGSYRVLEDGGMDLHGPRKTGPPVHLVYSTANAEGQVKARARKLATAAEELDRLGGTARTPLHPTPRARLCRPGVS